MDIDKAIELMTEDLKNVTSKMPSDLVTAMRLGIAALKRLQEDREHYPALRGELLQGETPGATKKEGT